MPRYPELASNRVLASFSPGTLTAAEFDDWLERLAEAGLRRRALLLSALAATTDTDTGSSGYGAALRQSLDDCAARLLASRAWTAEARRDLQRAVQVPDDYVTAHRVLGFYPITSLAARLGVRDLHREVRETFRRPIDELPREGVLRRYVPLEGPTGPAPPLTDAMRDTLGLRPSRLDGDTLGALLAAHAPVLEVDVAGPFDVPGAPFLDEQGVGAVEPALTQSYSYASVMPFDGELLLQLVYVFWFDARPRTGLLDALGGDVDGIVWRVTLGPSGEVLLYDSIHPCGCYHQFFPGERLRLRPEASELPEPPLVPAAAPALSGDERIVLRIESGRHYLQRILTTRGESAAPVTGYVQRPYGALYRVPAPGGHESFFAEHGLVPGTQRRERFYLWPMGVRSPGAMRVRGRQATAFVGRRHFDDADLLDALFERANPGAP